MTTALSCPHFNDYIFYFSFKSCWCAGRSTERRTGTSARSPRRGQDRGPGPGLDQGLEVSIVATVPSDAQSRRATTTATTLTTTTSSVATSPPTVRTSQSTCRRNFERATTSHPSDAEIDGPRRRDVAHDRGRHRGVAQRDDRRRGRVHNASRQLKIGSGLRKVTRRPKRRAVTTDRHVTATLVLFAITGKARRASERPRGTAGAVTLKGNDVTSIPSFCSFSLVARKFPQLRK